MNLPNMKSPCADCPLRKDSMPGWLGKKRITEILKDKIFVCHKTVDYENGDLEQRKQCAGHLHLKQEQNEFYALANSMGADLGLKNRELVFDNEQDCINHHTL